MDNKTTIDRLHALKHAGEKIVSLTAYDASFARVMDELGVDVILVGDSLGMVLQGAGDTLSVTVDNMVYHSQMVSRACKDAIIVVDMPYHSYETESAAYDNAMELIENGGAEIVKLEGGLDKVDIVASLTRRNIAVCGHVGLQPQSVKEYGGYKVQGRTEEQAERILSGAKALQDAGACMVVLECVPQLLAARITSELDIPTIGIGAGVDCDGQVLVVYDMLGLSAHTPHMAKNFLHEGGSIQAAISEYIEAVKTKQFPGKEQAYN